MVAEMLHLLSSTYETCSLAPTLFPGWTGYLEEEQEDPRTAPTTNTTTRYSPRVLCSEVLSTVLS